MVVVVLAAPVVDVVARTVVDVVVVRGTVLVVVVVGATVVVVVLFEWGMSEMPPPPPPPTTLESGRPAMSSKKVITPSATTNTMTDVTATTRQLSLHGGSGDVDVLGRAAVGGPGGVIFVTNLASPRTRLEAVSSVTGVVDSGTVGTVSVTAPSALVPPIRRSRLESGARTAACTTA